MNSVTSSTGEPVFVLASQCVADLVHQQLHGVPDAERTSGHLNKAGALDALSGKGSSTTCAIGAWTVLPPLPPPDDDGAVVTIVFIDVVR